MAELQRKIIDLIVYTRVYIALGSALVVYSLSIFQGFGFSPLLGFTVFGAVFAVYAMNRKSDIEEDEENIDLGGGNLAERTYYLGLISFILALITAYLEGTYVLVATVLFIAILSAYSFRFLPKEFKYRRLKEVPFLKNIVVGFSLTMFWMTGSLVDGSMSFKPALVGIFSFFFLRVVIGSIIPDIRDIQGDRKAGVDTIPVLFGTERTKLLMHALNSISLVIFAGMIWADILPDWTVLAGMAGLLTFPLIWKTDRKNAGKMTIITESNTIFLIPTLFILGLYLWL